MTAAALALSTVFDGWDGYQAALLSTLRPLAPAQLAWRPAPSERSAGEIARHIALGRLTWFFRMQPPGAAELTAQIEAWQTDPDGNRHVDESAFPITESAPELVRWLEAGWAMIDQTLQAWTVDDLLVTYRHTYQGQVYAVSRQWTIFRILAHDLHHGGQLATTLGLQGLELVELGDLGGHLTLPPLAGDA